jgi:putative peptide zinc metalloprotease protein
LPSRSLGTQGGGAIAVDASDELGLTAIEPVFEFDVLLPSLPAELSFAGSRVLVKFVHDSEPLTRQWGRRLRQLFLSRLQI